MRDYAERRLNLVRQIFKHDNHVIFRIYASVYHIPENLPWYHHSSIYDLKVQTVAPFACYINHQYVRAFTTRKEAQSITQERVNTVSRQFGFTRRSIWRWFKE